MDASFDEDGAGAAAADFYNGEEDETRCSGDSSSESGFATAMNLRKNLASTFEKQVAKPSLASTVRSSSLMTSATASTSTSTNTVASTASNTASAGVVMSSSLPSSSSVIHRIAQFEAATSAASKPPLPLRQQSNVVPSNHLAVYLRIRPSPTAPGTGTRSTTTIEVLKPKHPNIHPTAVRTYPPPDSNASKSHRETSNAIASNNNHGHAKQFDFSQVLPPTTTQTTVYSMVASPLLEDLFQKALSPIEKPKEPQSALLFSYGITNAGKTHTILGDLKSNNDAKWGIIPRAISDVLDRIRKLPKVAGQVDLYMSFFEIYNEQVYDLVPKKSSGDKNLAALPAALKVRERHGQTVVRGLAKHQIRDIQQGIELTVAANQRRHTSSNKLNSDSSRSHCVCQMQLIPGASSLTLAADKKKPSSAPKQVAQDDDTASVASMGGYSTDEEAATQSKASSIWIVDLAGSERSKRTGMTGIARQKEASQINKSLMTLMRCLSVMREGNRSNSATVVPFRESKLTHVFMGHLTGPCANRTAIIVNVNPCVDDFDETQHVLAYASHAKLIQMDPQELQHKRQQYFGEQQQLEEYGMDGHKKQQQQNHSTNNRSVPSDTECKNKSKKLPMVATSNKSSSSAFARMLKKLSPKKIMSKLSPKKTKKRPIPNDSRKPDTLAAVIGADTKRPPLFKQVSGSSFNGDSNHSRVEPATKRHRAGATIDKGTSTDNVAVADADLRAAHDALAQAKAELQKLQAEKQDLLHELAAQESQIRMEVSEEMEERLRVARERNSQELERLRALVHSSTRQEYPHPITRKARFEETIDNLLDKVDECEGEIQRMRQQHEAQIAQLIQEHKTEMAELQGKMSAGGESSSSSSKRIAELELQLQKSRQQADCLKKSKLQLVENYEQQLKEAREGQQASGDQWSDENNEKDYDDQDKDDSDDVEDEENMNLTVPLWKQKLLRKRKVLGNVSNKNEQSQESLTQIDKMNQKNAGSAWIFPKVEAAKDENGVYRRPNGRVPSGREWDERVGAWKQVGLSGC